MPTTSALSSRADGPTGATYVTAGVMRPGYDATFSVPKLVSVLFALGDRDGTFGLWSPPTTRRWQDPSSTWRTTPVGCAGEASTAEGCAFEAGGGTEPSRPIAINASASAQMSRMLGRGRGFSRPPGCDGG